MADTSQAGGDAGSSGDGALRPAKRVAAPGFDTQAKYPDVEPEILSSVWDFWNPVPGTLVETETEINFQWLTPSDRWVRFAKWPFYIEHVADYKNQARNAQAAADSREILDRPIAMARDRFPPCYIDTELGLYSTTFARVEFTIDGVCVTNRGQFPLGDNQALYQKVTRSFLTRGERGGLCDTRERVRYTEDISDPNGAAATTDAYKAAANLLHFDTYVEATAVPHRSVSNADGIWPLSRRDPILNKLYNRSGQASNPLIRPKTLLEARFVKHTPRFAYIQTDANRLTDDVALSGTPAVVGGNAGTAAYDVRIRLKTFKILYELLEVKEHAKMMMLKELKYYHDRASVSLHTLTAGVDTAIHAVPVERGTRLLYVVPCYSHQVYYNAAQFKNRVMRFPVLDNLKSIKFQLGDTPIYSSAPIDGLQSGKASLTPSSFHLHEYLHKRKLFDEPFAKFRPDTLTNRNYVGGIFPIDLTAHSSHLAEGELRLTLNFEGAQSPANAVIMVVAVSEAVWRCEVASKRWTLETVLAAGAQAGDHKKSRLQM